MEKKLLKKTIPQVSGPYGTLEGYILIYVADSSGMRREKNHTTHEEAVIKYPTHKIETYIEGVLFQSEKDIDSEKNLLWASQKLERQLLEELTRRVTVDPVDSIEDSFKKLGFENLHLLT